MKKLLFLAFFFTSFLVAQNAPNLLFVNKENNIGYGGTIYTTNSTKDTSGNTYLIGSFTNMADFDPSVAEANMNSINEDTGDMFIANLLHIDRFRLNLLLLAQEMGRQFLLGFGL
ncbi:hypothetical protein [Flavobacterium sp.]|uniref:hypothetical protein n=1 Tax=Flavobacterium sp. TaxID=239 RepID=UPI0025D1A753|nr:hypothetical protein [Flavobacterium sp.]